MKVGCYSAGIMADVHACFSKALHQGLLTAHPNNPNITLGSRLQTLSLIKALPELLFQD
jgi:hypothetical protein